MSEKNVDKLLIKKKKGSTSIDSSLSSSSSDDKEKASSLKNSNLSEQLLNEAVQVLNQERHIFDENLSTKILSSSQSSTIKNASPSDFVGDLIKEKLSKIKNVEEVCFFYLY